MSDRPVMPTTSAGLLGAESGTGVPLRQRVQRVLDAIRPAVQSDGGDLELLEVTAGGVVKVRLHGACVGCPSASMTLKMGIERNLRQYVPEVRGVEAVEPV
ncbi:MAG: NifU family protein [Phycisphaerales bacterium]|nr:NifU family protein [Phycisphaerales bacterium]